MHLSKDGVEDLISTSDLLCTSGAFLPSILHKLPLVRLQRHKSADAREEGDEIFMASVRESSSTTSVDFKLAQLVISIFHHFGWFPPAFPAVCSGAQRKSTTRRLTRLIKREVTNNFSSQTNKPSQGLLLSTSQKTRFTDFCLLNDPSPNKAISKKSDFHPRNDSSQFSL